MAVSVKHLARRPGTTAGELVKKKNRMACLMQDSAQAPNESSSLDVTEGCINFRRYALWGGVHAFDQYQWHQSSIDQMMTLQERSK